MKNIHEQLNIFENVFAKELSPGLAENYVCSLKKAIGEENLPFEEFVQKGSELHNYVGEVLYGPLISEFIIWIAKKCKDIDHTGQVYFALRDAMPLFVAANILLNGSSIIPSGIYINRPMLGIEDELSPEKSVMQKEVSKYLDSIGFINSKRVVLIDTGAWGTVVKELKQKMLSATNFYPFFWYSHNPHIPGFINELMLESGLGDDFGEKLNDSLECVFPQMFLRPVEMEFVSWGSRIRLLPSNLLAQEWGQSALNGVQKAAIKTFRNGGLDRKSQIAHLLNLAKLSESAKKTGQWTGVLPTNTPTWSEGRNFIDSWPNNLLP